MINTNQEKLLPLSKAARLLPKFNGKHPNPSTIWRWCTKGIKGIKLEAVRVGNRYCTSAEALDRFLNRDISGDESITSVDDLDTKTVSGIDSDNATQRINKISSMLEEEGI